MYKPMDELAWSIIKDKNIKCFETSCKSGSGVPDFWTAIENYFFETTGINNSDKHRQIVSSQLPQNIGVTVGKIPLAPTSKKNPQKRKKAPLPPGVSLKKDTCC